MSFNKSQIKILFQELIHKEETEVIECREAKEDFDFDRLGKYFSALSNEANLKNKDHAWLIFGVRDKDRSVVGTDYRAIRSKLEKLKGEIARQTTPQITFVEIYELQEAGKRVVLFQIPKAPRGMPVKFKGHCYGRNGEELSALNTDEYERIRAQSVEDWSAFIIENASLDDLYPPAIQKAKENYSSKFPDKAGEIASWSDMTFLNKAKIAIKGKITRAAIVLLGREESEHFLSPSEAKIRWILKDLNNNEKDFDVFTVPLLLAVEKVYAKIRNIKYRYLPERTLFPEEVLKYEPFIIREAVNNCIAHQDYTLSDKVQKKHPISNDNAKFLIHKGLIEGRKPNYYISSFVAANTSDNHLKAQYIKHRGLDDEHYKSLILKYIEQYGSADRKGIDALLFSKLPDALNEKQKSNKISNLLSSLRREDIIENIGSDKKPKYTLKNL